MSKLIYSLFLATLFVFSGASALADSPIMLDVADSHSVALATTSPIKMPTL